MLNPLEKAENVVMIVKRVMVKSVPGHSDLYLALLDPRNTSSRDIGCSTAQGREKDQNIFTCFRKCIKTAICRELKRIYITGKEEKLNASKKLQGIVRTT